MSAPAPLHWTEAGEKNQLLLKQIEQLLFETTASMNNQRYMLKRIHDLLISVTVPCKRHETK